MACTCNCFTCIKLITLISSFLIWAVGCVILGLGIWVRVRVDLNPSDMILQCALLGMGKGIEESTALYTGTYTMMALGVLLIIITFVGYYGSIKEHKLILGTYLGLSMILCLLFLGVSIWAQIARGGLTLKDSIEEMLHDSVKHYKEDAKQKFMDAIQRSYECCGATIGFLDFPIEIRQKGVKSCKPGNLNTPCSSVVLESFYENLLILARMAFSAAFFLTGHIVFNICFCRSLKMRA